MKIIAKVDHKTFLVQMEVNELEKVFGWYYSHNQEMASLKDAYEVGRLLPVSDIYTAAEVAVKSYKNITNQLQAVEASCAQFREILEDAHAKTL
jgi:hypothetical protein